MSNVLTGVRVLEVANFISGPFVGQLLADLGAEVVKIENPAGGDGFRSATPPHLSTTFCAFNPNKKSVTLNFTKPQGAELLKQLAARSDILVENFRPGVMDKSKVGWEALSKVNPRLIYCSITGFGRDGPYHNRPSYDSVASAISGFSRQVISPRHLEFTGPATGDAVTGLYSCYGILGALYERERTGVGRYVEVTMIESMIALQRDLLAHFFWTGETPSAQYRPALSQCFALRCADGKPIAIHLSWPPKFWENLLAVIGRPDLASDPRFATRSARVEHYEALADELGKLFMRRPRAEWVSELERVDVPFAPINDFAEVFNDPQTRHLGTFSRAEQPGHGETYVVNRPVRYDGERPAGGVAPLLGEHTAEVLGSLGLLDQDLARLRAEKII